MDSPEVVDDFELGNDEAVNIHIKDKEVNKQKLRRRIDQYKVSYFLVFYVIVEILENFELFELVGHMQQNPGTEGISGTEQLTLLTYFVYDVS